MKNLRTVMVVMVLTAFTLILPLAAQAQTATIKEKLSDGGYIVSVDGTDFRAITRETADSIVETNKKLDQCQRARAVIDKQITVYETTLTLLKKDRDLADVEAQLEREHARRIETMYNSEYALRLRAEALNNAHSKKPWPLKLFDNPYVDVGFKAIVPTVSLVRSWRN